MKLSSFPAAADALLTRAVDVTMRRSAHRCDFLEIEGLDESEKLVLSILDCIVDETVGEEH